MLRINRAKQFRVLLVIIIAFSFLFTNIYNADTASGEYAIAEGDSFDFNFKTLQDKDGSLIAFQLGGVLLQQGCDIEITFTIVDPPLIQYKIKSSLSNVETKLTLLANIFVQDREWDQKRENYEALGYVVYENDKIWGVRDNRSGNLDMCFNKKDGVMTNFYAYNYSGLTSQLPQLFHVEINRFGYGNNNLWMISFIYIVPIVGTIIGFSLKAAGKGKKV
ncbi:MAG: hypothetical protein ACTSO7_06265 [Candidatus Heimdallarchaeota archaeon]